jgi:hypothetical protein
MRAAVVVELERNLETEKPRMNVDLSKTLAGDNKVCTVRSMRPLVENLPRLSSNAPL